ncbi:MAG: hypothetical protein P1U89_05590 [Verrucomicrobiales bacterium]|nr:hypothetical protein [Verrucomicrobiales bacterium]
MKSLFSIFGILGFLALPFTVQAQFHQPGQTAPRQMNSMVNGNSGFNGSNLANRQIRSETAYVTPTQISSQNAGSHVKIKFKKKMPKETSIWGRAENHSDGTYTETISDIEHVQADNLVIQHTKKKSLTGDDPIVLERKITLNPSGNPDEVMIYDGRGSYKYRGKFVYDNFGRVIEQRLWSSSGAPLRKVVQKYDHQGEPLPLETYDYSKNIPADLQLVVTQTDPLEQQKLEEINSLYQQAQGKGLFANRKKRQADIKAAELQERMDAAKAFQEQQPAAAASEVGGNRFRLFSKRKRD